MCVCVRVCVCVCVCERVCVCLPPSRGVTALNNLERGGQRRLEEDEKEKEGENPDGRRERESADGETMEKVAVVGNKEDEEDVETNEDVSMRDGRGARRMCGQRMAFMHILMCLL